MDQHYRAGACGCLGLAVEQMGRDLLIRDPYVVLKEPFRSKKGICLTVATRHGPKTLWCGKRTVSLFRYKEGDKVFIEVWIPVWLQEKAGLN